MHYTDRDAEIVKWLGLVGAAGAEHVIEQFGMPRTSAYKRLRMLAEHNFLSHRAVLYNRPEMYWATRQGLRWQGLTGMPVFDLTPMSYEHTWAVLAATGALRSRLPGWSLIYERELRRLELDERRLIASAERADGTAGPVRHRPDFALVSPSGRVVAVEVERSHKPFPRMCEICRAWAWASHVDHVYYLALPKAARAVTRAMEAVEVQDKITVLELGDVAGLAERELAREQGPTTRQAQASRQAPEAAQETQSKEEVH